MIRLQDLVAVEDRKKGISEEIRRENPDMPTGEFQAEVRCGICHSGQAKKRVPAIRRENGAYPASQRTAASEMALTLSVGAFN